MVEIKRPLAVIGFTFFITGSAALSMSGEYIAVLLALFALLAVVHWFTRKIYTKHLRVMLVTAAAAVVYISVYNFCFMQYVKSIPVQQAEHIGYISEITNNENTGYTVMLVDEKHKEKYAVSLYYQADLELGDVIRINGKFSHNKNNKYVFLNYSRGILGRVTAKSIEQTDIKITTVKYKALTVRKALIEQAEKLYNGDYLALVAAMGYSDKHFVSDNLNSAFKSAGLSHALVVSGFHIGIIVYALMSVFKHIPVNKKIKNISVAIVIIAFMYIIGFTPSVVRAGALAAVVLVCLNIHIEQDSVTTLALIGFVCIIRNPYITRDIGAMLSYSAAMGIIVANEYCKKREIKGIKHKLICSSAAVIFTMPVLALAGMYVTLLSPLFNLLLAVPVSAICVLSVVTPIINLIPVIKCINTVLVMANTYISATLIASVRLIDEYLGFAFINLSSPVFTTVFVAAIVSYFVVYIQTDKKQLQKLFVITVSICTFLCYNLLNYNVVTVTAFDSGREASFHISFRGKEYLILSEWMTQSDAENQIYSANGKKFEHIYYCPKEFKYYTDFSDISNQFTETTESAVYNNEAFTLICDITDNKKLFTIAVADCDIRFAHGKTVSEGGEYYFLGNDKPQSVTADEIYIFGNIPSWMEVDNIIQIDSDLNIKINLKTGEYKTVKDVLNFGW